MVCYKGLFRSIQIKVGTDQDPRASIERKLASLVMIPPKIHKEGPIVQGRSQEFLVGWVPTLIQERQDLFCCKKYYKICKY